MQLLLSSSPNWYLSHVVSVTSDGSVAAYAGHLSVTVLCCRQQLILRCLWPQRIRVSCITFAAADTLLVAGYEDGSARCFDWQSGECVCSRAASKSKRRQASSELTAVVAPTWLEDAAVFADAGGQILQWPFTGGRTTKYTVLVEACGSKVVCLAAAPAHSSTQQCPHQVIAGCQDGSCVLVDVAAGCQVAKWKAHTAAVHSLLWWATPSTQQPSSHPQQPPPPASGAAPDPSAQVAPQQQQQQQQHVHVQEPADSLSQQSAVQQPDSSSDRDDASCLEGGQKAHAGFVVSSGGDRRLKVWQVPCMTGVSQHAAAADTTAGPGGAATAEGAAAPDGSSADAAEGVDAAGASSAGAPGAGRAPVVLQLQPLSAAVVDPSPPAAGPKYTQQYYGAAALVPDSTSTGGSCMVVCAGVNGRLGVATLVPDRLDCQWAAFNKSPHTAGIFQLLLQPWHGTTSNKLLSQQELQQQHAEQAASQLQQQPQQQEQQQQQDRQQQPDDQELQVQHSQLHRVSCSAGVPGDLRMLSVSVDRCFAMSKLTLQTGATPPPAPDTAGPSGSTSSTPMPPRPVDHSTRSGTSSGGGNPTQQDAGSGSGSGLQMSIQQCSPMWVCQGMGGFAYTCAVQRTFADTVEVYPKYSKVRVAVGCGDKTIRVVSLGVRLAPTQPSQQQQQQEKQHSGQLLEPVITSTTATGSSAGSLPAAAGASAGLADDADVTGQLVTKEGTDGSHSTNDSSSSADAGAVGSCVAAQAEVQLQLPVSKPTLLWKHIQDRIQAVAWHPTNPRLLAFGCADGCVGVADVASSQVSLYSKRHGGPVTHVVWNQHGLLQQQSHGHRPAASHPQQQQQQQRGGSNALLSLGGEGCLLSWPAISPGSNSSWAQPVDVGAQLQPFTAAAVPSQPPAGRDQLVHWSCLVLTECGSCLALCGTRGQLLTLQHSSNREGAEGVGGSSSSSRGVGGAASGSWRSSNAAGAWFMTQWQLQSCSTTPSGLPVKAAAWQPRSATPFAAAAAADTENSPELPVAGAGHAADAGGQLLVVVDDRSLHVCGGQGYRILASCSVGKAQQQQQQQLLTVTWCGPATVCVGCSDGSIQVVQITTVPASTQPPPAAVHSSSSGGISPPDPQVLLQPLHSLKGHSGPVLCVGSLPGWPGLLLSGSQDQTLRSWHLLQEAAPAPTSLQCTQAATATQQQQQHEAGSCSMQQSTPVADSSAGGAVAAAVAAGAAHVEVAVPAQGAAATPDAAAPAVDADSAVDAGQQPGGSAPQQSSPSTQADGGTTAPAVSAPAKPSKKAANRLFVCPKAKPFLPELPDTSDPMIQQQALLDVVALAEALYPVPAAAGSPNPSTSEPGWYFNMASGAVPSGLNPEVLQLLGVAEGSRATGGSSSRATGGLQQQQQQQSVSTGVSAGAGQQVGPRSAGQVLSVAGVWHQQLSAVVGQEYAVGSWLPHMTADVPELLVQHQQWTQQQQQSVSGAKGVSSSKAHIPPVASSGKSGSSSSSSDALSSVGMLSESQLGMLQFISGDVKGFLQAAVADCVTPDVVALSAAGGAPAFAAAAKLAAAKLTAGGAEPEVAALHWLAAGDVAAAAAVLQS